VNTIVRLLELFKKGKKTIERRKKQECAAAVDYSAFVYIR